MKKLARNLTQTRFTNSVKEGGMSYEQWKAQLIEVTAKETGRPAHEIKINDDGARSWFEDGFTPYQTFRETYQNEQDTE